MAKSDSDPRRSEDDPGEERGRPEPEGAGPGSGDGSEVARGEARPSAGAAEEPNAGRKGRAGAELLRGKDAREILRRLFDDDPLEIQARCAERLDALHYMLDMSDLYLQALAYLAHDAASQAPQLPLDLWIDARIDRAIETLLRSDRERERDRLPVVEPFEPRFLYLAHLVGIEPGLGRQACVRFNALPVEERRVFWAVHLEGKSVKRHVAEGHGPPELARRRLRHVMQVLSGVGGSDALTEDEE